MYTSKESPLSSEYTMKISSVILLSFINWELSEQFLGVVKQLFRPTLVM